MADLKYTKYVTVEGDRWDLIAQKAYKDPTRVYELILDNPDVIIETTLPVGLELYVRILANPETGELLPPWKTDEQDSEVDVDPTDTTIPVVEGGGVLQFSNDYPKIEGNKIVFAINKSGNYTYSVEKVSGGVVSQSPGYLFTAGFPVSTPEILDNDFYIVKVGSLISDPITILGQTALSFTLLPFITQSGSTWNLQYSINKNGNFPTKITRLSDNVVVYNETRNYTPGTNLISIAAAGVYKIEILTLRGDFTVANITESTAKPDWLTAAGFRYDSNSKDFTLELSSASNLEVNVIPVIGSGLSGRDQSGNVWNSVTYNPGLNTFVSPGYTERFSFNKNSNGTGGLSSGTQFKFSIRRTANPGVIFALYFTTPSASTAPGNPTVIELEAPTNLCPKAPTIYSFASVAKNRIDFYFDGEGVYSLDCKILNSSNVAVRTGTVDIANETTGQAYFNPSNKPSFLFDELAPGNYFLSIEGGNCYSLPDVEAFTITTPPVDPDPEPEEPEQPTPGVTAVKGVYEVTANGRVFTSSHCEEFTLTVNANGTLSDATPGIDNSGAISKQGGKNVFYQIGYGAWGDTNSSGVKVYKKLQDIYFPDHIYTFQRFCVDPATAPDLATFIAKIDYYITTRNTTMQQINMSIWPVNQVQNSYNWLKVTRSLRYPIYGQNRAADGTFGTYLFNTGMSRADIHAKGVNDMFVGRDSDDDEHNPLGWQVFKYYPDATVISESQLYQSGFDFARNQKCYKTTMISNEIPENTQGVDPGILQKMHKWDEGVLAGIRLNENNNALTPKDICNYGSYGGDELGGVVSRFVLYGSRAVYIESLTTKLHKDMATGNPCIFYDSGDINYRSGCNFSAYFYASNRWVVSEMIYYNERLKLGSKTYQGQDREAKWIMLGTNQVENLGADEQGRNGVEYACSRDIIPFPGGEIAVKKQQTPQHWNEYFNIGVFAEIIGDGFALWGLGRQGTDTTKFDQFVWEGQPVSWRQTGGSWESYVSGQNGAPERNNLGISQGLYSAPTDGAYAGSALGKFLKSRCAVVSHATYNSSRGGLTATPGSTGLHLNGKGPVNMNSFTLKDSFDGKKGLFFFGTGPGGKVAMYINEHLSEHEYEDNVTGTFEGQTINLGRCYGRKFHFLTF